MEEWDRGEPTLTGSTGSLPVIGSSTPRNPLQGTDESRRTRFAASSQSLHLSKTGHSYGELLDYKLRKITSFCITPLNKANNELHFKDCARQRITNHIWR